MKNLINIIKFELSIKNFNNSFGKNRIVTYIVKYGNTFAIIFLLLGLYSQTVAVEQYLSYKTDKSLDIIEQKLDFFIKCSINDSCSNTDLNMFYDDTQTEKRALTEKIANYIGIYYLVIGFLFLVFSEMLRNKI